MDRSITQKVFNVCFCLSFVVCFIRSTAHTELTYNRRCTTEKSILKEKKCRTTKVNKRKLFFIFNFQTRSEKKSDFIIPLQYETKTKHQNWTAKKKSKEKKIKKLKLNNINVLTFENNNNNNIFSGFIMLNMWYT